MPLLGTKILGMNARLFLLTLQVSAAFCFITLAASPSPAQGAERDPIPVSRVVLTKLSPPLYPPLPRQAHITGDVKLQIWIWRDGRVASVEVVSGHPMLKSAAAWSAQQSTFECHDCSQQLTSYTLTYTFSLRNDIDCSSRRLHSIKCLYLWACGGWRNAETRGPAVVQTQNHITILTDAACVETSSSNSSGD
jgi:TonB family protein